MNWAYWIELAALAGTVVLYFLALHNRRVAQRMLFDAKEERRKTEAYMEGLRQASRGTLRARALAREAGGFRHD